MVTYKKYNKGYGKHTCNEKDFNDVVDTNFRKSDDIYFNRRFEPFFLSFNSFKIWETERIYRI